MMIIKSLTPPTKATSMTISLSSYTRRKIQLQLSAKSQLTGWSEWSLILLNYLLYLWPHLHYRQSSHLDYSTIHFSIYILFCTEYNWLGSSITSSHQCWQRTIDKFEGSSLNQRHRCSIRLDSCSIHFYHLLRRMHSSHRCNYMPHIN